MGAAASTGKAPAKEAAKSKYAAPKKQKKKFDDYDETYQERRIRLAIEHEESVILRHHNLRSLNCQVTVALLHHKKDGAPPKRMLVQMRDTLRWQQFREWAQICLWGVLKAKEGEALKFEYIDELGGVRPITNGTEQARWLHDLWCQHPIELRVFEAGVDRKQSPEEEKRQMAEAVFRSFDLDGSGTICVQEMMMAETLAGVYDADPGDIATFLQKAFKTADADGDAEITLEEFMGVIEHVSSAMVGGFLRGSGYRQKAQQARALSARSWRKTLEEIASSQGKVTKSAVKDALLGKGGTLELDAQTANADSGVSVRVAKACLSEATKGCWLQATTVSEDICDSFEDPSDVVGTLMSALVLLEFEEGTPTLPHPVEVTLPHCFHENTAEEDPLLASDVVVAFSTLRDASWTILRPDEYELVEPEADEVIRNGEARDPLPAVRARVSGGGVLGVFSNNHFPAAMRVVSVAFAPHMVIPLEPDMLRVHLLPDLPHELAAAVHRENTMRGLVVIAGSSKPFRAIAKNTILQVEMSDPRNRTVIEKRETLWAGAFDVLQFRFDPEQWLTEDFANGVAREAMAEYLVSLSGYHLLGRRKQSDKPDFGLDFPTVAVIHCFPKPTKPRNLRVISRTLTSIETEWEPPEYWGGCAIAAYELQLREIDIKGNVLDWRTIKMTKNGSECKTGAACQIYKAHLRVRAKNVGTYVPGDWSDECELLDEKAEMTKQDEIYRRTLDVKSQRTEAIKKEQERRAKLKEGAVAAEEGVATISVTDEDLSNAARKEAKQFKAAEKMEGWSSFSRSIGEYFLEAGIESGVQGTLFELKPQQVEKLYRQGADSSHGVGDNEPLVALATSGVWVMETLAHHTDNPKEWIKLINDIDGLIDFAGHYAIGVLDAHQDTFRRWQQMEQALLAGSHQPKQVKQWQQAAMRVNGYGNSSSGGMDDDHMKSILNVLLRIFMMMRQCSPGGFISCHLSHRYQEVTRNNLKREWKAMLKKCTDDIGEAVGHIVEQARSLSLGRPTASERIVLSAIGPHAPPIVSVAAVNTGEVPLTISEASEEYGCVGHRVRSYKERTSQPPPQRLLVTQMAATGLPSFKPSSKSGPTLKVTVSPKGSSHEESATSLAAAHLVNPIWANECLSLPLESGSNVTVELEVTAAGAKVGFAKFSVTHAVGRFEGPLMSDSGKPSGAVVSIFYQAPAWGDVFADPTAAVSAALD